MTSSILANVSEKAKEAMTTGKSAKIADLSRDTKDVHSGTHHITLDYGVKQINTDDWLTIANDDKTGPMLLEDSFGREKIHRFDHERIPERVVHARGAGAFGKFTLFEPAMRHTITKDSVNYWPNRFEAVKPATAQEDDYHDYPEKLAGIKPRTKAPKFREHFNQAQLFYNSMSEPEKQYIAADLGFELGHCDHPVVYTRMCERLTDIDLSLAQSVAELVGGDVPQQAKRQNHGKKAKGLSQLEYMPKTLTIATRRIAIILADGFDPVARSGIKAAITAAGTLLFTISISPTGRSKGSGKGVAPDHHLEGMRSTMFDSIFVLGGAQSIETLRYNGRTIHWVREAFGHLKAIGAVGEAVTFVKDLSGLPSISFSESSDVVDSYRVVTAAQTQPGSFKEGFQMAKGAKDFVAAYFYAISRHKDFERESQSFSSMVAN